MTTRQYQKDFKEEPEDVTWKNEYSNGLIATFEDRHFLGTKKVAEYELTFSNEEGCCLSFPEYPMDDIFFVDTKSEIEKIAGEIAIKLQKVKTAGLAEDGSKEKDRVIDEKAMYWINEWNQGKRILPARGGNPRMGRRIECKILLKIGKPSFRELCKGDKTYKLNIELDNKDIFGKSDNGNIIQINNLGRWLFGVPGYKGNAIFNEYDGFVYLSNETPEIIDEMIKRKCKEYAMLSTQDRRWPISIYLTNDEKDFKVIKNWIEEINDMCYPIVDHPRRLYELTTDPMCRLKFREKLCKQMPELININDRVLFLQPYHYSEEDLDRLDKFCRKNSLNHVERENSPFYIGTKLIIVYEEDSLVEEKVKELLSDIDDVYKFSKNANILAGI